MIKKTTIGAFLLLFMFTNNSKADARFWTSNTMVVQQGTGTVRSDGFDVVFGGTSTELSSFREAWTTLGTATFWVKLPTLPAGTTTMYYVYYNNSNAVDLSTFSTVFTKNYEETGLKGAWRLDEGTGIRAFDSSGNGNHGTLTNGPAWQAVDGGQWKDRSDISFNTGSALAFCWDQRVVVIADSDSLDVTTGLTVECWLYSTNTSAVVNFGIIYKGRYAKTSGEYYSGVPGEYEMYVGGSLSARVALRLNNQAVTVEDTTNLTANQWEYISATYDGSHLRMYRNGTLTASVAYSTPITVTTHSLYIGNYWAGQFPFAGIMDDIRLYNRALSPAEIQAHYERRKFAGEGVTISVSYGAEENNPGTIYPEYLLRRPITIHNSGTTTLTNFQVKVPIKIATVGPNKISD